MKNKYLLPIIEGVAVISIELIGTKLLIPYFGNSLQIWSISIFLTMIALSLGYLIGAFISKHKKFSTHFYYIILFGALTMGLLPWLTPFVVSLFDFENLHFAYGLSALLLIVPPIIIFACLIPIAINQLKNNSAGAASGITYGISTFSSVIFALFIGFYLLETFGIIKPLLIIASIIIILNWFFYSKNKKNLALSLISIVLFFGSYKQLIKPPKQKMFITKYHSESPMGQLKVFDTQSKKYGPTRIMQVNGVTQTYMYNHGNYSSVWQYPHIMSAILSNKPRGSKALLIGLAGGSLAKELVELGYILDVVEIDKRMINISENYFNLNTNNVFFKTDDARHYIRTCNKKYDVIAIDILSGEIQPNHVFTMEGFKELQGLMNDNAILGINYQSLSYEKMKPTHSIYKTMEKSGLNVKLWQNELSEPRDLVFVAKKEAFDFYDFKFNRVNKCCYEAKVPRVLQKENLGTVNYSLKQPLLTDDLPILETMNQQTILNWRKVMIRNFSQKKYQDLGYQLYE